MKSINNKFSWSIFRHSMFLRCKREYFYHYYGSWNGWDTTADERTILLNRLKNIQSVENYIKHLLNLAISSFCSKNVPFSQKSFLLLIKRKINTDLFGMGQNEFFDRS